MIELDHVDCNVCLSCSKTCAACSHASPFTKPFWLEPETLRRDLAMASKVVHFKTWFAVGGEPTLHPKLLRFLDLARESGIADEIGVITNGDRLTRMPDAFWEKIDVLRLSMYGDFDKSILELAEQKSAEFDVELNAWPYPEFFFQLKREPDDGVESFKNCVWKTDCMTIHEGHFWLCPQSIFFPPRFLGHESTDGLPLEGLTEENLSAYINRTEPFEACRVCCAGEKKAFPWKESKSRTDWVKDSTI